MRSPGQHCNNHTFEKIQLRALIKLKFRAYVLNEFCGYLSLPSNVASAFYSLPSFQQLSVAMFLSCVCTVTTRCVINVITTAVILIIVHLFCLRGSGRSRKASGGNSMKQIQTKFSFWILLITTQSSFPSNFFPFPNRIHLIHTYIGGSIHEIILCITVLTYGYASIFNIKGVEALRHFKG